MRKDRASHCDAVRSLASTWLFGREWLRSPLRVGAVAPSSARLAESMTQGLMATCGPVIELCPGTGVFTAALLRRGIPAAQVAAIEASESFAAALALRFPQVAVIHDDAARIRHVSPFGPGARMWSSAVCRCCRCRRPRCCGSWRDARRFLNRTANCASSRMGSGAQSRWRCCPVWLWWHSAGPSFL